MFACGLCARVYMQVSAVNRPRHTQQLQLRSSSLQHWFLSLVIHNEPVDV